MKLEFSTPTKLPINSKAEIKFKDAVKQLITEGKYPGPQRLNRLVHGHSYKSINGRELIWRRHACKEMNFHLHGSCWDGMHFDFYQIETNAY